MRRRILRRRLLVRAVPGRFMRGTDAGFALRSQEIAKQGGEHFSVHVAFTPQRGIIPQGERAGTRNPSLRGGRSDFEGFVQQRVLPGITNAFSKKLEPHYWMVSLYTVFHNFIRIHKTLKCTPAMAAGLSKTLWSMDDLVAMIDAAAEPPKRPRVYKVRISK